MSEENRLVKVSRETLSEVLAGTWNENASSVRIVEDESTLALRRLLRNQHPRIVEEVFHCLKEYQQVRSGDGDFLLIEDRNNREDAEGPFVVAPLAYLRAMLMTVWETFRHPLSTTTIDLATGRVVDRF